MSKIAFGALWIFVFAVPWDRLIVLPGINIITKLTGGLALGLAVFAIVVSGRVRRWRLFHIAGFLFVVWMGASIWLLQTGKIPLKFYTFAQLFLVVWMIWELAPSAERLRKLLVAYVFGCVVPAVATFLLYLKSAAELKRFSAGGADGNSLAMTLALAMPMAWYLSLTTERPLYRWMYRAYIPLGLLASVLTGSRGGMITWMVALLIIPLTTALSPGRLAAAIGLLGLSAALIIAYVPDRIVARLGTTTSSVEGANLGGRFRIWVAGVHAFAHKPMMGYGVGGFKAAITPELGDDALVAHNSYLSVLVEEGIVGFVLYMTMLLAVVMAVRRLPRLERRFGLSLLATLGIAMLPLTWEDQKQVWFIIATMMGMAALATRRRVIVPVAEPVPPLRRPQVAVGTMRRTAADGPRLDDGLTR